MSDIMKQIQELQEQFSNLFEVEGVGEPAMDVPPSTNKLKKDIKTKDGKVQLVSVEDELFPKDGNKKEQFQQKVIDTINGMIQGTATLQDLLQIVRQPKKAPLKEAMELMEAVINEFNDDVKVKVGKIRADRALDSMKQLRNNSIALRKAQNSGEREKIANEMSKNSDELDVNYKKAKKFNNLFNKNVKDNNKKQELKNYIESRGASDDREYQEKASEALKEAMEVLESLLNEGKNLDAVIDRAKKGSYEQRKVLQNKYGEEADWTENLKHPDVSIENIRKKEGKEAAGAEVLKGLSASIPDSKTYKVNKRSKGAKNIFSKTNFTDTTNTNIGNVDSTLLGDYASDKRQTNKAIGRHYRKLAKLKEAMEVLENIIQESSHKRKYGNANAADGDTVGHLGTKYFKDGSKMHPHRVTKSNGHNGVYYAPHGTEYYDFDDKKTLQDAIKNGKDQPEGEDFKKIQKDLTKPTTKNDMYGKNLKWVANTLANRGKDYVSTVPNTPKDTFTYIQGRMDKNRVKTDPTILGRVDKTKKRIKSKMDESKVLETWENAIKVLEGLFVKDGRGDLLDDVDTTLGSPVKRAVKGAAKQVVCPKKKEI